MISKLRSLAAAGILTAGLFAPVVAAPAAQAAPASARPAVAERAALAAYEMYGVYGSYETCDAAGNVGYRERLWWNYYCSRVEVSGLGVTFYILMVDYR